eukprot:TRINITY_DN16029_c0_g1_i1.p1 TRINITY_DN16029_c0_g1~~TRINITY_DN16029_c0_g1_i1.p1  ORF type:complete len:520 (+),score=83.12 TRINITY_DN16029_c0_g1_i1:62-1621(+)
MANEEVAVEGNLLSSARGDLYVLTNENVKEDNDNLNYERSLDEAIIKIVQQDRFQFTLCIATGDENLFAQELNEDMNPMFLKSVHALEWVSEVADEVRTWRFVFQDEEEERNFKYTFATSLYETKHKADFAKMIKDEGDRKFVLTSHDSTEQTADDKEEEDVMDFEPSPTLSTPPRRTNPSKNRFLSLSLGHNRSFVVRGSELDVYAHNDDDKLEYVTSMPEFKSAAGEIFAPTKMLLHRGESQMLLLNPENKSSLTFMDIETNRVVQEWKHEEYDVPLNITNLASSAKYAQRTAENMVVALNHNSIFSIDTRANCLAQKNQYATRGLEFTSITSTGDGYVAVSDAKGDIRLYNDISKKSKTNFPGLGDGILGLDVTEDGRWLLATCQQYLLVIPTIIGETENLAFEKTMPNKLKPTPIKLQLKHSDCVKHQIRKISFTPAQFNTGDSIEEEWIVSSTGPFIITWNFKKIKNNKPPEYKITKSSDQVVSDQFRFNRNDQVVVTLPNDVYLQKRTVSHRN